MSRVEQLRKLIAMDPNDPMSHYGLGLEFINQQRWDEAIVAFDDALRVDANYSSAYYHKARAQIAAGRVDRARETLSAGMAVAQAKGDWHTRGEMNELLESLA